MTDLGQITFENRSTTLGSPIRYAETEIVDVPLAHPQPTAAAFKPSFDAATLAAIPRLRAFALSLSRNADRADDLVQETLLRAYSNAHRFEPGSNLDAWLITILRNQFYSDQRRRRREVEDGDGAYVETLVIQAEQGSLTECEEYNEALSRLPDDMRKALVLIGAYGFSYREAARLCACAVGTIKSRVHRARTVLASMSAFPSGYFGEDSISQSVVVRAEETRSHHR